MSQPVIVARQANTPVVVLSGPPTVLTVTAPGPRGPAGPAGAVVGATTVAAANVQAWRVIALTPQGGVHATATDRVLADRVLGISTSTGLVGESVPLVLDGTIDTPPLWTPGPLFLGLDGELTSTPGVGVVQIQVACAITPSRLIVRPGEPIHLKE